MITIQLNEFAPVISDEQTGLSIYSSIKEALSKTDIVIIDMTEVKSMATFCSKQIFGSLYKELGPTSFYSRLQIKNANDDIKVIIRMGIVSSLAN